MTEGTTPPPEGEDPHAPHGSPTDPFRVAQHAARARRVAFNFGTRARRLNAFERVLWGIVALIAFIFGLVILIPFLILGVAVVLIMIAWITVRRAFTQGGPPRTGGEGRENVRVIRRNDP
ncbi:MAG: hypothetical protein AAF297_01695 [Planctomycetota bacterium]